MPPIHAKITIRIKLLDVEPDGIRCRVCGEVPFLSAKVMAFFIDGRELQTFDRVPLCAQCAEDFINDTEEDS